MTRRFKALLNGAGSVLDVAPAGDYRRFVPRQGPDERMRGHWMRVGDSLRRAMDRYEQEAPAPAARP
jgi:hypothetical protein